MSGEKEKYKWFIAHIAYHSDLKVKDLLDIAGIDYYMPYHDVDRTWNGIRKEFRIPSLTSCVFIRIEESDFIMLHLIQEVSLIVDSDRKPICITEDQMKEVSGLMERSAHKGDMLLQWLDGAAH